MIMVKHVTVLFVWDYVKLADGKSVMKEIVINSIKKVIKIKTALLQQGSH